jgi:hypothetical protein
VTATARAYLTAMASTISLVAFYLLAFAPAYVALIWMLARLSSHYPSH